jgi:hypothetical protein
MTDNTPAPPRGIVQKLASKFEMTATDFGNMLVNTVFPNGKGTASEVFALCLIADEFGLNPLLKQIYAFPGKGGGIVPVIGVDGWYRIMNEHPQFDGIEFDEKDDESGRIQSVACTIHRKDRSIPLKMPPETLEENKRNTEPWNKQPRRMLRHRAAIQAIRVAFSIGGVMDEEDAARMAEYEVVHAPVKREKKTEETALEKARRTARGEKTPEPEPEPAPVVVEEPEILPPEPDAEPDAEPAKRTRRSRAVKSQVTEFEEMLRSKLVDPSLLGNAIPDEPDEVDLAFASMWRDEAEAVLERARTGEFRHVPDALEGSPVSEGGADEFDLG